MKVAIMQPTFLPWLGYFKIIESVDFFVFLDCVQFERQSWQSKNRIKVGENPAFLTLNIAHAPLETLIKDIKLMPDKHWKNKLLKTFYYAYFKAKNFQKYYDLLKFALFNIENLCDFNIFLIEKFCADLEIKTPRICASKLEVSGKREGLLVEICKILGGDFYLSPEGSKCYLETSTSRQLFAQNGIKISYFDFSHPIYNQLGSSFLSHLGAIDYLCNNDTGGGIFDNCFAI